MVIAPQILKPLKSSAGITLIEIMIVIGIIAGLIAAFSTSLYRPAQEHRKFLRRFTLVSKEVQVQAKLTGKLQRLVIDFGRDSRNVRPQAYWVESATKANSFIQGEPEISDSDDEIPTDSQFVFNSKVFKKKQTLPRGLSIYQIELTRSEKPLKEGVAYIYFLPEGLIDEAAIHFLSKAGDEEKPWTVLTNPVSSISDLTPGELLLKETRR